MMLYLFRGCHNQAEVQVEGCGSTLSGAPVRTQRAEVLYLKIDPRGQCGRYCR